MHFSAYAIAQRAPFVGAVLHFFAFLLAFIAFALISAAPLQAAGTVTIVDGPNTAPAGTMDLFNDGYIQNYLNITGSLTSSTANSTIGGVNELRVEPGVVITWTSGNALTLSADANLVVSGTLQHDGPVDGSGGVSLLAGGDVQLGSGTQPCSIAAGNRHGLTRVEGENVRLQAGDSSAANRFVLLGFRAVDQGITYTVTGPISVTANLSVTALAGANPYNFAQIGHGGADLAFNGAADGNFGGDITILATDIRFGGGSGDQGGLCRNPQKGALSRARI